MTEKISSNSQETVNDNGTKTTEWDSLADVPYSKDAARQSESSLEQKENQEEILESLKTLGNNLGIEISDSNLELLGNVLGGENRIQTLLEDRDAKKKETDDSISRLNQLISENNKKDVVSKFIDNKTFKTSKSNLEKEIRDNIYEEWNSASNAEETRRRCCLLLYTLFPGQIKKSEQESYGNLQLKEEKLRRQVLSNAEVQKLGSLSKRFEKSYHAYEEPTLEDIDKPTFDKYFKARM